MRLEKPERPHAKKTDKPAYLAIAGMMKGLLDSSLSEDGIGYEWLFPDDDEIPDDVTDIAFVNGHVYQGAVYMLKAYTPLEDIEAIIDWDLNAKYVPVPD